MRIQLPELLKINKLRIVRS